MFVFHVLIWLLVLTGSREAKIGATVPQGRLHPSRFNVVSNMRVKALVACGDGLQRNSSCPHITGGTPNGNNIPCHSCEPSTQRSFPIAHALDGDNTTEWRSPNRKCDSCEQRVTITISLGQVLRVTDVSIHSGSSSLPRVWELDWSRDGKLFHTWKVFVTRPSECRKFARDHRNRCTVRRSTKWLEHAKATFSASYLRLRFLRMRNEHQQSVSFYSIRDLHVFGRCICHGHAKDCQMSRDGKMECVCHHNTCGRNCESCCHGYTRKGGKTSRVVPCEMCYCNKFASVGMQCNPSSPHVACNCRTNFRGDRCDRCTPGFWGFPNCSPCKCNAEGASNLACNQVTGRCPCKPRIRGKKCDRCPISHYDFPRCKRCQCNNVGSHTFLCDDISGQCLCKFEITGRRCDRCYWGYYNFPECWWCNCEPLGTTKEVCHNAGQCKCNPNFQGVRCHECKTGYYDFPKCIKCACSTSGFGTCGNLGQCICKKGYTGISCDWCADGYYGFPHCRACRCNSQGSKSLSCERNHGRCRCKYNVMGDKCDRCAKNLVGFPTCEQCSCNPAGTRIIPGQNKGGCSGAKQRRCLCKMNVQGELCDRCRFGYYKFTASNPQGCSSCGCSGRGTVSGIRGCHVDNGLCSCKSHVTGPKCSICKNGFYQLLSHDIFGCRACQCNPGGSVNDVCHMSVGQCKCRPNIYGKMCDRVSSSSRLYFPTLYHIQAELEEGLDSIGIPVLSSSDPARFPSFSGAGYFAPKINEDFSIDIQVPRTSTYRVIVHYALKLRYAVSAQIRLSPKGASSPLYRILTYFKPTVVGGKVKGKLFTVVMNRKKVEVELTKATWTVFIRTGNSELLLDYITLLPEEYYKATVLQKMPSEPCLAHLYYSKHCAMYAYYTDNRTDDVTVPGSQAFLDRGALRIFKDNRFDLGSLRAGNMALLGDSQIRIHYYVRVQKPGDYALLIKYFQPQRIVHRVYVYQGSAHGMLEALPCQYQFACQQVVIDDRSQVMTFHMTGNQLRNKITLGAFSAAKIGIISITAILKEKWSVLALKPFLRCNSYQGRCESSSYDTPKNAVKLVRNKPLQNDQPADVNTKINTVVTGLVRSPEKYHVIIHYKQLASLEARGSVRIPSLGAPLTIDVTFEFCPTLEGCRLEVQQNGNTFDFTAGSVFLLLNLAREISVEYILLVPKASFKESLLQLHQQDNVNTFMKYCSKNNFFFSPSKQHNIVCRDSAFTLTTHFTGGLLKCACDRRGSTSASCNQFGGRCRCRKRVVGRRCDRCMISYTGFPRCRRCFCSISGSTSQECDVTGKCLCSRGFGGQKCNRCTSFGYYGYPNCKACNCDTRGSLSMFCGSYGQCQCRQNFEGLKCDRCRVGYYDFPVCKQCNCNPAGIKLLSGQQNTCGNGGNDTKCTCKDNVQGVECDECRDLHFNLDVRNPLGCEPCGCDLNGTLGSIGSCNKETGECLCKDNVNGRICARCRDGYYGFRGQDMFGCKRCKCNAGGSFSSNCDELNGQCSCLRGIAGIHCDRISSSEWFFPDLHHVKFELEEAKTTNDDPVTVHHNLLEFPGFSRLGYTVLNTYQTRIHMLVHIPQTTNYRLIFHYSLSQVDPVGVLVKFVPTLDSGYFPSGRPYQHKIGVRFKSTASWLYTLPQHFTVDDSRGRPVEVLLSQGKWKLTLAAQPSTILLDYLVLLPEFYYRPTILKDRVFNSCEVNSTAVRCLHHLFPSMHGVDVVTLQAERGTLSGTAYALRAPFSGVQLHGRQNVLSITIPHDQASGSYVFVASYFHAGASTGRLEVTLTSGQAAQRGWMNILSCNFTSGCRQVAIDGANQVRVFKLGGQGAQSISAYTRLTMALDSITIIPHDSWAPGYLSSAPQCVQSGPACIPSTYYTPDDAIVVQAENTTDKNGIDVPRPPYLLDQTVRLEYIGPQQKTLHIYSKAKPGRYYVIVHFFQPQSISFHGHVIISSQIATPALVDFRYCPFVTGCRAVGMFERRPGFKQRVTIGGPSKILLTVVIPKEVSIWIDYLMLVPTRSYSSSLIDTDPVDTAQDFQQDCARNTYFIKPSASRFCIKSVFALTARFHGGAVACECDKLGSLRTSCQSYGGQCQCLPNVIGRTCNKCRTGYRRARHSRGCEL